MIKDTIHEKYMQRCIDIARQGLGNTAPNPMVGSVLVYNNKIIGEGFHRKYGENHAEVNAINSVHDKSLLKESTIYVNLEPCSHYGKTPPCADLIKEIGIPNVVIGSIDTASHVSGKGIDVLKNANCSVITGVLEDESRDLNKRFFTFHEKQRPYVILKWAQTKDGFIDIERDKNNLKEPTWITNENAKTLVHKWRSEEQSILIGTNTALADNPSLTTRNWKGKSPIRIVLDRTLLLPRTLNVFNTKAETVLIADKECLKREISKYNSNVGIEFVEFKRDFYTQLFNILIKKGIQSIIIEGGSKVLNSFINNGLWDEARIFQGDKIFNKGVKAPKIVENEAIISYIGNTKLMVIKKNS